MELQKLETHVVEKSQDFPEKEFTIRANAQSFKILSSGLYSDKIAAIVRELCTNAYDSHVLAGNEEKPFDIYFPNHLAPFFKVRDYGMSIAHEDMPDVYCTFFGSTKTSSNLQQGAFGLGSKAFLSYVSSASVTTFIDGTKRMYVVLLNEAGLPTINYLGEAETDEENGLEVQLPVNHGDFYAFTNKVSLLKHFPVKPNIHGIARFEWPESFYDDSIEGPNWKLFKQYKAANHIAVMGYIAYPIAYHQLDKEASQFLEYFADDKTYIEMHLPIGAFEITPSREQISYDLRTVRVLSEQVLKIKKEFVAKLENEILTTSKTYFEACKFYDSLASKSVRTLARSVKYNGRELTTTFETRTFEEDLFEYNSEILNNNKVRVQRDGDFIAVVTVNDIINTPVFYADIPNAAYVLRSWLRLETEKSRVAKSVYLVQDAKGQKYHSKFLDVFGFDGSEIRFVSELIPILEAIPKPPKKQRSTSLKPETVKLFRPIMEEKSTNCLIDVDDTFDINDGGIWTPINAYDSDKFFTPSLSKLLYLSEKIGLPTPSILGVRKTAQTKFQKHPKWKEFDYYAFRQSIIDHILINKTLHDRYITSGLFGYYLGYILNSSIEFNKCVIGNTDNLFKTNNPNLVALFNDLKIAYDFTDYRFGLMSEKDMVDLKNTLVDTARKKKKEFEETLNLLKKKYPLLELFSSFDDDDFHHHAPVILDYLNNPQIHEAP